MAIRLSGSTIIDDSRNIINAVNVGIGTTNPTNPLTVYGSQSDTLPIVALLSGNGQTSINNGAQIAFGYNGFTQYQHFVHTRHNAGNSNNAIDFYVCDGTQNNTLTSGSVHTMSLVSGNVGVGTFTPSFKLDVRGLSSIVNSQSQLLLHPDSNASTVIHRNDASDYYILLTNAATTPSNSWNTLRPFSITLSNGRLNSNSGQSFTGNTIIGGGPAGSSGPAAVGSRSTFGLTVGVTTTTTFAVNADVGDGNRTMSIVNDSSVTGAMSVVGFRVNPTGGTSNAMMDMKFVQTGATNTSALHYSFLHNGSWADRVTIKSDGTVGVGTTNPTYNLHVIGSLAATTKSFVINHPTKPGKKLRYASLEGPENGVYVRGRTQDAIIELPDYWTGLVDSESITVNLTPIGESATPRVKEVANNQVLVFTKEEGVLDYYYTVYAERKDVEKLEVEI